MNDADFQSATLGGYGLDSWGIEAMDGLSFDPVERTLQLSPLPRPLLTETHPQPGALRLAVSPTTREIWTLGAPPAGLRKLLVASPATNGETDGPRVLCDDAATDFSTPPWSALAFAPQGSLLLAGLHRVAEFAGGTSQLIREWGPAEGIHAPREVAVDHRGTVCVADARGIHRFAPAGRSHKIELPGVTRLAVAADGCLAAIAGALYIFHPDGARQTLAERDAVCAAFSPEGRLYALLQNGRLETFERIPGSAFFHSAGSSAGLRGFTIHELAWWKDGWLVALVSPPIADATAAIVFLAAGDDCAISGKLSTGCQALDAGRQGEVWHRVKLDATLPAGSSVKIESATGDDETKVGLDEKDWKTCLLGRDDQPDCLVLSEPGRYLRLRLTLSSDGHHSPVLRRVAVTWANEGLARYLPAVFQEDRSGAAFLESFLAMFQAGFDDLDAMIDAIPDLFDPATTRPEYLQWLGAWLGVEFPKEWTELPAREGAARMRRLVRDAAFDSERRGTLPGLEKAVRDLAGVPFAHILEHYRLRTFARLAPRGRDGLVLGGSTPLWSPGFLNRLQLGVNAELGSARLVDEPSLASEPLEWGAHCFSIYFPADPRRLTRTVERVRQAVEREKPAHTRAYLRPVFPRFRVGVQATLGIDTMVAGPLTPMVLAQRHSGVSSRLGYDTVLGRSPRAAAIQAAGGTARPRIGLSTRLL